MPSSNPRAVSLVSKSLVWDNHACMPLRAETRFLPQLQRMRDAGTDVVSLNVSFDGLEWTTAIRVLSTIRAWLADHADRFVLAERISDITKARESGRLAITFDLEGMTALDGRVDMVRFYHDLGVRWMLIAYNAHNEAGGGCLEADDPGLTAFGRRVLDAMAECGMVVCCSHTGERTCMDAFEHADAPVILSHSNPRALCDHPRNVTDPVIDACAATGGVIGIVGFGLFLKGGDVGAANVARHIDYVVQRVGPQHVGYSSDYVFDRSELDDFLVQFRQQFPGVFPEGDRAEVMVEPEAVTEIADALIGFGYTDTDVAAILGGNWLRVAESVWKP